MNHLVSRDEAGFVLAVLNDQIRPPITIQSGSNKQIFGTYAFTINLVPFVLEETCFAGHTFEYRWKTKQNAQSRKRNADPTSKNQAKPHSNEDSMPSTVVGEAQTHPGTDHMKVVTRWAH